MSLEKTGMASGALPRDQSPKDEMRKTRLDSALEQSDPVEHPSHYTYAKIEVIDFIEACGFPFHLGNAVKYIARAGRKDPEKEIEDLQKAVWYLNRYIGLLQKEKEQETEDVMDYDSFCQALERALDDGLPLGYLVEVEKEQGILRVITETGDVSLAYRFKIDFSRYIRGVPFDVIVDELVDGFLEDISRL